MRTVSKKARRRKLKGSHESYETGPDAKEGRDSHCGARPELGSLIFRLSFVALNEAVMVRGLLRTSNLPQLQNLVKRDPVSYKEEFLQQWNHYNSTRRIFQINPDEQASHFRELVTFISQARISICVCGMRTQLINSF